MANAKLAAVVMAMLVLLQVSSCAAARHHAKPEDPPCGDGDGEDAAAAAQQVPGTMRHTKGHRHPSCSSPAVSRHGTRAVMTVNGFQKGEDGGGPAACDGHYHSDRDKLAALSTGWYAGGRRCHKAIRITSVRTGRTVEAQVVDECDSRRGCKNNIVDTSAAVWKALGLDTDVGEVPVVWSDA
ncbi:hypothetical protein ACP70R_037074 [Stipagrostis hirtigluma subsp. patula]